MSISSSKIYIYRHREVIERDLKEIVQVASVNCARNLTHDFFKGVYKDVNAQILKSQIIWALYDQFFSYVAIPYLELENFLNELQSGDIVELNNFPITYEKIIIDWCEVKNITLHTYYSFKLYQKKQISDIIQFLLNTFLTFYSLISFLYFILSRKKVIGIWTGDYTSANSIGDPRIGELYERLEKLDFEYLNFIRTTSISPKVIVKNLIKRKRPAIYYQAFTDILPFFYRNKSNEVHSCNFFVHSMDRYAEVIQILLYVSRVCAYFLRLIRMDIFICWFYSFRTASLFWACNDLKIKTIGFMHGMSNITYMAHEYMPEYSGPPIGPDKFGVWSAYWKDQFVKFSKIYSKDAIEISGPLRPLTVKKMDFSNKLICKNVFIISEAGLNIKEAIPYYEKLVQSNIFNIYLKIRHFGTDLHYKQLKEARPDLINKMKIVSKPVSEAFKEADIVIGSHSTAVFEAGLCGIPFLFYNTKKWGNFYNLDDYFVSDAEELLYKIKDMFPLLDNNNFIMKARDFLGSGNGIDWIIDQCKS